MVKTVKQKAYPRGQVSNSQSIYPPAIYNGAPAPPSANPPPQCPAGSRRIKGRQAGSSCSQAQSSNAPTSTAPAPQSSTSPSMSPTPTPRTEPGGPVNAYCFQDGLAVESAAFDKTVQEFCDKGLTISPSNSSLGTIHPGQGYNSDHSYFAIGVGYASDQSGCRSAVKTTTIMGASCTGLFDELYQACSSAKGTGTIAYDTTDSGCFAFEIIGNAIALG